jgi:hypothetical protein
MPVFVHLTSHRNVDAIRRGGIRLVKRRIRPSGVHAMPVTRSFNISHQWVRELRRSGGGTIVGIYFRIPDDEPVEIGHYDSLHVPLSAAEAVALMLAAEGKDPAAARAADKASKAVARGRALPSSPEGFEVVIPRAIAPSEILRIRTVPQVTGWRYRPGANGARPCACICCERGAYGVTRLLRRVEEDEAAGRTPKAQLFGRPDRSWRRVEALKAARAKDGGSAEEEG